MQIRPAFACRNRAYWNRSGKNPPLAFVPGRGLRISTANLLVVWIEPSYLLDTEPLFEFAICAAAPVILASFSKEYLTRKSLI
jgi:hypothetical protein